MLHHMYQAWQQDNSNYVQDWYDFVIWAARWNCTTADDMLKQLQNCKWFIRGDKYATPYVNYNK